MESRIYTSPGNLQRLVNKYYSNPQSAWQVLSKIFFLVESMKREIDDQTHHNHSNHLSSNSLKKKLSSTVMLFRPFSIIQHSEIVNNFTDVSYWFFWSSHGKIICLFIDFIMVVSYSYTKIFQIRCWCKLSHQPTEYNKAVNIENSG